MPWKYSKSKSLYHLLNVEKLRNSAQITGNSASNFYGVERYFREVFPRCFQIFASISRAGVPSHEADFWLDSRNLNTLRPSDAYMRH